MAYYHFGSRGRRTKSFRTSHPVSGSGMSLEHSGTAEHKGFGAIVWIIAGLILTLFAFAVHGMASAINP